MSTIGPFELHVRIVGGKNLRDVQTFGKQDPYVAATCNGTKLKTRVHESGGRNPTWGDKLAWHNIYDAGPSKLVLVVKDKNRLSDVVIGSTSIDVTEFGHGNVDDRWWPLFDSSKLRAGEVHLRCQLMLPGERQLPRPIGKYAALGTQYGNPVGFTPAPTQGYSHPTASQGYPQPAYGQPQQPTYGQYPGAPGYGAPPGFQQPGMAYPAAGSQGFSQGYPAAGAHSYAQYGQAPGSMAGGVYPGQPGYGAPPASAGYTAPGGGYSAPPGGFAPQAMAYGGSQGFGAAVSPPGYGGAPAGYGGAPAGYGGAPAGYGGPPAGAPPSGGPPGYGGPPAGAPPSGGPPGYGGPPAGAPPSSEAPTGYGGPPAGAPPSGGPPAGAPPSGGPPSEAPSSTVSAHSAYDNVGGLPVAPPVSGPSGAPSAPAESPSHAYGYDIPGPSGLAYPSIPATGAAPAPAPAPAQAHEDVAAAMGWGGSYGAVETSATVSYGGSGNRRGR